MNKKGVVFTVIAVILLSVIMLAFLVNIENRAKINIKETTVKVETVNNFVTTLNNNYLPLALRTSSNQVILALLNYTQDTQAFLPDTSTINSIFKDVLLDGYYGNDKLEVMFLKDLNYTLAGVLEEIEDLAAETGIVLTISGSDIDETSISISHEDAWNLKSSLKLNYEVKDTKNEVKWDVQNREVSTLLDIENYRDPVYLVKEGLNISIRKWDGLDFNSMVYSAKFNKSTDAPDFLQRLQGKLSSSSANGIETMLDPYSDLHSNPDDYSNADHHYWTDIPGQCTVVGFPANFRLKDQAHLDSYSLQGYCA